MRTSRTEPRASAPPESMRRPNSSTTRPKGPANRVMRQDVRASRPGDFNRGCGVIAPFRTRTSGRPLSRHPRRPHGGITRTAARGQSKQTSCGCSTSPTSCLVVVGTTRPSWLLLARSQTALRVLAGILEPVPAAGRQPFVAAQRSRHRGVDGASARAPVPSGQQVLFNRHALASADTATASLWFDVKRVYLELRPDLRRLYLHVPDADRALAVLAPLGFAVLPNAPVQIADDAHWTLMNDFGPGLDRRLAQRSRRARARGRRAHSGGPGSAPPRARRPWDRP